VFSQTTTGVLACLVLMGAVGTTGLISGGSASSGGNSGEDPDLSVAEVVALRFPSEAEEAASAPALAQAQLSPVEQQILSILAFNPNPLGIPGPRAWAPEQGAAAELASAPAASSAAPQSRPAQPARSAKRQPQTLFNDAQIANIKQRLRLTREQEQYWPQVEAALRYIGWRHSRERSAVPTLDPDDVQRLKYAAIPLVMNLREDQKHEIRALAHVMGLEKLAAEF
jgi:hypothetical protein